MPSSGTVRWGLALLILVPFVLVGCGSKGHSATTPHRARRPAAVELPAGAPRAARIRRARAALVTHGPRRGREIALTFDADMTQAMLAAVRTGHPTIGYDPAIVSELRASRTPATVFMTGLWPTAHPGPARALARDPLFEIENHTFDHAAFARPCYGLPDVPSRAAKTREVKRTARVIAALTGAAPRYLRFPGGCHGAGDVALVAALGERPVQWDVISGDAYLRDPDAVARQTLRAVRPGSIVVMHLVGAPNAPATAAALRTILPALRARGLRPVKLERLLGSG
jgi:peptidoglycan/xylan/chitin deacetylase (PgdA/CDA1 family)